MQEDVLPGSFQLKLGRAKVLQLLQLCAVASRASRALFGLRKSCSFPRKTGCDRKGMRNGMTPRNHPTSGFL